MIKRVYQLNIAPFFFLLIIIGFNACNSTDSNKASVKKHELLIDLNKEFQAFLENNKENSSLLNFYRESGNELLWLNEQLELNNRGIKLVSYVNQAENFGLSANFYDDLENIDSINGIEKDTLLTACFLDFIQDLKWGILAIDSTKSPFPNIERKDNDLRLFVANNINKLSFEELIFKCQPEHVQYHALVNELKAFNSRVVDFDLKTKVSSYKSDSLLAYENAAKVLFNFGLIDSLDVIDSVLIKALKVFQLEHGLNADGVIGSNTAKALSRAPEHYLLNASLALEKWRKRASWSKDRIAINIAGFHLKYFENDELERMHRVVVGTNSNKTIEILDTLEYLVVYPFWYVPSSIISKELIPKAKKDSSYFRRNGYELLSGGTLVNSEKIDYNAGFRYTVRQKGGKSNALGLIKFIFPNPSYIYLHDTPSKKLFNREIRTFSHGCIRLEDPLDLAKDLLEKDNNKYSIDSVDHFIKERKRTKVFLNNKLPIYIHYTLASTKDNHIVFHEDVYGRDEKMLNEIKKLLK